MKAKIMVINKVSENFSYFVMNMTIIAVHIGEVLIRTMFSDSVIYFRPSNIKEAPIPPNIPLVIILYLIDLGKL